MSFLSARSISICVVALFSLVLSGCFVNTEILGASKSSVEDIFTSLTPITSTTPPVSTPPPVSATPPVSSTPVTSSPVAVYPVDLTTAFFADDFNRANELLPTNIKWSAFQGQSALITNQELNSSDNGGFFYATPNNPAVFPDLTKVYLESSVKMDGSMTQLYTILPYVDVPNMTIVGCYFKYDAGVLSIAAGDYMAYMTSNLAPFVTLAGYPAHATNYVGCEVDQASGTATAYLNSTLIGTTTNLTVPSPANSEPIMLPQGNGVIADNVKAFASFAEGRMLNDGDLRIYNTPFGGYYLDQLANFSLQGYCANNGATVQIKDASPGTFQSSVATCTNNGFTINVDLSDSSRFPSGANQIRIEYVNAGNTTEYTYNFSNLGVEPVPPPPPALSGPTPTTGNSATQFAWTVTYPAGSVVNLTPSYISVFGDSADCVASVTTVSATTYTVKVTGCTYNDGLVAIKILAASAKDSFGTDFPESADSTAAAVVNALPDFIISTATPTSGSETTTFRWTLDYSYTTTIDLSASYVQVLGASSGCSVDVVTGSPATRKYVDVTNCGGNGLIGLKILAGSGSNANGTTAEKSTAIDITVSNPIEIEFLQASDSVLEGSGAGTQNLFIKLSRPSAVNLDIHYSVVPEFTTATNPASFNLASSGTVTIPAGQTTWPISYVYQGDAVNLGTKIIQVAIDQVTSIPGVYVGAQQVTRRAVVDEESLDNFSQISVGHSYMCGVTLGEKAKCWGYNYYGQLGNGTAETKFVPTQVTGADNYTMVSSNEYSSCGITSAAVVKCWGYNASGQLGNGTTTNSFSAVTLNDADTYTQVSVGTEFACGINSAGRVKCWGSNGTGQLGGGTNDPTALSPVLIGDTDTYSAITTGSLHACGITTAGSVRCWGMVNGSGTYSTSSYNVDGSEIYTKISAGAYHTCGITSTGAAKCWGNNAWGQLGNGAATDSISPVFVSGSDTYIWIAAGRAHTCGVTSTGIAKCWGENSNNQLGDGTNVNKSTPTAVNDSDRYVRISAGDHTCGITNIGSTKCWGTNYYGQLGLGDYSKKLNPTAISSSGLHSISAGFYHSCGITSLGSVKCWGQNNYGQLANARPYENRTVPTSIIDSDAYTAISTGVYHTCGVTTTGTAKCWGAGYGGQLGDGTTVNSRPVPQAVLGGDTYLSISASFFYTCGLTSLGTAKCWGGNPVPTVIGGGDTFTSITAGRGFGCGITPGGTVKCWGDNYYGVLGNGTTTSSADAVAISDADQYTTLSAGWYHVCGITTAGIVKCWGANFAGALGNGTLADNYVPTAVSDGDTYVKISSGAVWTCGTTTAGFVKCWGANSSGQLGDGTIINRYSPTPINDVSTYSEISATAEAHTCGVTTSGIIKCWGTNADSALGIGNIQSPKTPTCIGQ